MRLGLLQRTFLLSSLVVGGALAYGCALNSEGQMSPDASLGGSGGGTGGTGGTSEAGADQETPNDGSTDVECFWPDKKCNGVCVNFDDPLYGCAQDTCEPCEGRPNSVLDCINNECLVVGCADGWKDCDGETPNGCETSPWDVANCLGCGKPCALPHATAQCNQGACEIVACDFPWANCTTATSDGCETSLTDEFNCEECFKQCTVPTGEPTCVSGKCMVDECPEGLADCNLNPDDGCETDITTTSNCGGCGLSCSGPNADTWTCEEVNGAHTCLVGECEVGWGNCDDDDASPQTQANGCEINLLSAVSDCGECGGACSATNTQNLACSNGMCVPTCTSGYEDCNGPDPGASDDGCETVVSSDENNCGSCGNVCNLPNANEVCQSGNCGIASCLSGWGNCDSNVPNGCETNLHTLTNCGACGVPCDMPNAGEQCDTGVCTATTCAAGWGDCTTAPGCETPLNTLTNCGTCGVPCNLPHATESCSSGSCQLVSCDANWGNCTGAPGCETDLHTLTNCGNCGVVCSFANAAESCATGSCVMGACDTNYGNCNGNPADGCETPLTTASNCGNCSVPCDYEHASETCATGTCVFTLCQPGYASCGGDPGCETSITNNVDACGACSAPCSTNHVTTRVCASGLCDPVCADGWEDCDGPEPGLNDDGCETDTNTSEAHCGSCGSPCSAQGEPIHATWDCQGGTCEVQCDTGWSDCNAALGCDCPSLFSCSGGNCKCDADTDCGNGGTCNNGTGLCTCTAVGVSTECEVGEVCNSSGACE